MEGGENREKRKLLFPFLRYARRTAEEAAGAVPEQEPERLYRVQLSINPVMIVAFKKG
jgi:hypothetical protein